MKKEVKRASCEPKDKNILSCKIYGGLGQVDLELEPRRINEETWWGVKKPVFPGIRQFADDAGYNTKMIDGKVFIKKKREVMEFK